MKIYLALLLSTVIFTSYSQNNKRNSLETIPQELKGNWFNTITGDWEFSLLDSIVIYKNKMWKLEELPTKKMGILHITNNNEHVSLNYKLKKDKLLIGEKEIHKLNHNSRYNNVQTPSNPPSFDIPILKMDTAILSGLFYGYDTTYNFKTGTIYNDNLLKNTKREDQLLEIDKNGFFRVKIPLNYPQVVTIKMKNFYSDYFLEPGENAFVLINLHTKEDPVYMGTNSRLTNEITNNQLFLYGNKFYLDLADTLLNMNAYEYKHYALSKKNEEVELLNELYKESKISDRYYQYENARLNCAYIERILRYRLYSKRIYQKKYPVYDSLPSLEWPSELTYYDFLDGKILNDETILLPSTLRLVYDALSLCPIIQSKNSSYTLINFLHENQIYKEEDKAIIEEFLKYYTTEFVDLQYSFNYSLHHWGLEKNFLRHYKSELDSINQLNTDELNIFLLVKHISQLDSLSNDYLLYCNKALVYYSNPIVKDATLFFQKNEEAIQNLEKKYSDYRACATVYDKNKILKDKLNIPAGLFSDIMGSLIFTNSIERYSTIKPQQASFLKSEINCDFIQDYINSYNTAKIAEIEANKQKSLFSRNEVPQTEVVKVFDAIVSKYKGNVVYVDFWATWCGPCRNSIKNQQDMKNELSDKPIKFIYITDQSSPEQVYNNMIPNIKGEHYRVSQDDWNYLSKKFNITAIPHYAIVNKNGEVIDSDASRDPEVLIKKFEELIKEEEDSN